MGARIRLIEVKKVQPRIVFAGEQLRRQAVRGHQLVAARPDSGKKMATLATSSVSDKRSTMDVSNLPKISLRAQASAERDQGLPIVVALVVENPVDPVLNGPFERFEELGGDDDGSDQSPGTRTGQPGVHQLRRDRYRTEVKPDQRRGRQGIGNPTLEDQVDIHQAVADDRPAKGQRQKDQANPTQLGQGARNGNASEKGDDIQHCEGNDGEQCSPRQPLQLLPAKWIGLPQVVA